MQRRDLPMGLLASAAGAALLTERAQAQTCVTPCYPQTSQESSAGVTPANTAYLPGDVRRYGADPSGVADSTSALVSAIRTGYSLYFCDGHFLTSGNLSPKAGTRWWGTGVLKSSAVSNTLVTISGITNFVFSIDTDLSSNTASAKQAITIDAATHIIVENGYHQQGGIAIAPTSPCSFVKIRGNTLQSTVIGSTSGGAVGINARSTDFEIINNEITGATGAGIAIYNNSIRGLITGNRCTACTGNGIFIASAQYLVVQGNICSNNQQSGIGLNSNDPTTWGYANNCTVSGNICAGNLYDGVDYNLASDNKQHGAFTAFVGNILSGNGSNGTGGTGIYLANVDEAVVVGNVMAANNQPGIFLNSAYYCTVSANGVVANGSGMASGTAAGITISGSCNAITGNTSTNNDGAINQNIGINETGGNNNCIVGNQVANNSTGTINTVGSVTNVQANQPVTVEKLYYADILTSFTTPSTTGIPNGSLWLNPGAGRLYVLQSGAWVVK
jgi:parallel beta-helix repeat protein